MALSWAGSAGSTGFTYGGLQAAMENGARRLSAAGWRPGDRAVLLAEPGAHWVTGFFALMAADLVAVPLPTDTPPDVVDRLARWVEARGILVGAQPVPTDGVFARLPCFRPDELAHPLPSGPPAPPTLATPEGPASCHPAVLAFTSGSTGQPRAVELSHANLLADVAAMRRVRHADPGDSFLSLLPPTHLFELTAGLLGPISCGARVVYPGTLLPNRILAALRSESITHVLCVPALLDALFRECLDQMTAGGRIRSGHPDASPAGVALRLREDLTPAELDDWRREVRNLLGGSLRSVIVGGAALDPAWKEIAVHLDLPLETGYGLTEAGPVVSLGRVAECPVGSVGQPLPGIDVRLGPSDEVLVRGPNVMRQYYRDPVATAAALEDGWLHTGDLGRIDSHGFLFITGRLKEVLVSAKGETIHPAEMEPHYSSPLFREHCVAGLRGPDGNDIPTLFAVPASPATPSEALHRAFEQLRNGAPGRCRVERLILLPTPLPRTATGKVRRNVLANAHAAGVPEPRPAMETAAS